MNKADEIVELASDAAFAINGLGQIAAWNNRAEQLLGYRREEVIARSCGGILQAVLPDGKPLCGARCEPFRCFQSCVPCGVQSCRIRQKNGDWRAVGYASLVTSRDTRRTEVDSIVAIVFLYDKQSEIMPSEAQRTLRVFTLGNFGLSAGGQTVSLDRWVRKQAVTLLKYLVSQVGRPVHRERIIDNLWPDVDASKGWDRLKVTISYLRSQLRNIGMPQDTLITVGKAYLLRRDAVEVDTTDFERLIAEGRGLQAEGHNHEALHRYAEAEHFYRGDFLEEETFADWCAEERERLRELYLEMLGDMVQCCAESGDYAEAIRLCRKALVHEPCRESFHRALIVHLGHLGRTDQAMARYRACQDILARELGVEPMPETQRAYLHILETSGREQGQLISFPAVSARAR